MRAPIEEVIAELPGSWYASQPIPDRLIHDLGRAPLLSEHEIDDYVRRAANVTDRDLRVLGLVAEGHPAKEIARRLDLTHEAVKQRLRHARRALGARNTTHAVTLAFRGRLIN